MTGEDDFTFGGDDAGAWGGSDGGTWGPQRERRYRLRLRRGDRQTVIEAVLSVEMRLRHSAVSSLSCEVPRIPGLSDYRLGTMELLFGDRRLFRGRFTAYPGPGTTETVTVGGPGPGHVLKRRDLSVSFSSRDAYDAIAEVWREYTPFSATVTTPNSPTTLEDFSAEGTVLEVLQALHDQAGMRWTIQMDEQDFAAESYVAAEVPRTQDWDAVAHESSGDLEGYANKVVVYGGLDSNDQRVTATAKDQAEIDALAADDIGDDGVIQVRVDDESLTTTADAQARADAELADRLGNDDLSGQLDIMPTLVLPGYHYDIPEWERDGSVPQLPVDEVSIQEAAGEAAVTLDVNGSDGPIDMLAALERGQAQLNHP